MQNLVIRTYCTQNNLQYLLSATEVVMPESYLMLEKLLAELSFIDGLVCYSLFQLPETDEQRHKVFKKILDADKLIHFAVESLHARNPDDVSRIEDIYCVKKAMGNTLDIETLRVILQ